MARKIEINHDKCIQCVGCASVCPFGAIELVGTRMKFYPEKCRGCGACVRVCPANCIRLVEDGKGTEGAGAEGKPGTGKPKTD